jgi:hypothetical protein
VLLLLVLVLVVVVVPVFLRSFLSRLILLL